MPKGEATVEVCEVGGKRRTLNIANIVRMEHHGREKEARSMTLEEAEARVCTALDKLDPNWCPSDPSRIGGIGLRLTQRGKLFAFMCSYRVLGLHDQYVAATQMALGEHAGVDQTGF
jgi:hypothetical protein